MPTSVLNIMNVLKAKMRLRYEECEGAVYCSHTHKSVEKYNFGDPSISHEAVAMHWC